MGLPRVQQSVIFSPQPIQDQPSHRDSPSSTLVLVMTVVWLLVLYLQPYLSRSHLDRSVVITVLRDPFDSWEIEKAIPCKKIEVTKHSNRVHLWDHSGKQSWR